MPIRAIKRPSGIYHLRGTHFGIRVDRSAGTRDKIEAGILASKEEKEIFERHAFGARYVATFAEIATDYLRAGGEGRYLGPLIKEFGDTKLKDIDQSQLDKAAARIAPGVTSSTLRRVVYVPFSAVWNRAVAGGKADPRVWILPKEGKRRLEWLRPAEAEALLAALTPEVQRIVTFYLGTGARASEAIDLVWADVSPQAERVTLWEDITKGGRDRYVQIGQRVRDALPERGKRKDPVFTSSSGEAWHAYDAINLALARAAHKSGVRRVSCHVLRHTWATWSYAVSRDLEALMAQGGWATPKLAMRYMHGGTDDLAAEVHAHGWELLGRPVLASRKKRVKSSAGST